MQNKLLEIYNQVVGCVWHASPREERQYLNLATVGFSILMQVSYVHRTDACLQTKTITCY